MTLCRNCDGKCVNCGAPMIAARQVCGTWKRGVGDFIADSLASYGVTPDFVSSVVGFDCGCDERKQLLNSVGYVVGIGSPPQAEGGANGEDE